MKARRESDEAKRKRLERYERARKTPEISFVGFNVNDLANEIEKRYFASLLPPLEINFVRGGPLACVIRNKESAEISLHAILNHREMPREVLGFILKHEILHIVIPAQFVNGTRIIHHPEFRTAEREIGPERDQIYRWLYVHFYAYTKFSDINGILEVRGNWKKAWDRKLLSLDECDRLFPDQKLPDDLI